MDRGPAMREGDGHGCLLCSWIATGTRLSAGSTSSARAAALRLDLVTFTLPAELRGLARAHQKRV